MYEIWRQPLNLFRSELIEKGDKLYYKSKYKQSLFLFETLDEMVDHYHVKLRLGISYKSKTIPANSNCDRRGLGTDPCEAKAKKYFAECQVLLKEAVEDDDVNATFDFGVLHEAGGDFENYSAAANYYEMATKRGHTV